MKIGIFGGTFDPPHDGHLAIAKAAIEQLQLDEVIFVPAFRNPLKQSVKQSPPNKRLKMLQMLVAGQPKMSVSDIEITRGGLSYMVDTLTELQLIKPGEYWLILGSDAVSNIYSWKQPEKIARLCRLAVILRPPHEKRDALRHVPDWMHDIVDFIKLEPMTVSSSAIRSEIFRDPENIKHVSPEIAKYIKEQRLYEN